jgi:putative transposase
MSRRARLHVPGGLYYVVQRGNARQPVFSHPTDYATFEGLLAAMLTRCRMRAHAFCWTEHTVHLAIEIADMPIGRLMQRLTSQYAREVHRKQGQCGHLFQQRYQALLIDPEAYMLKLIRHIHTVPVRLGTVGDAADYPLSSHRAYLGITTMPWLTTSSALRLLGHRQDHARQSYGQFMLETPDADAIACFERGGEEDPRVLGDRSFMSVVPRHQRVFRSSHSLDQVIDTVARTLAVEREEVLSRSRQRRLALARALIAWYATERGIATLAEVARRLQRDPSTLFVAVERYRSLRPELFSLSALHDSGPLLRMMQ